MMMLRGARGRTAIAKRTLHQQPYFTNNAAICFTGQGSQYPGMGLDVYKNNNVARRIIDEADAALGFKISDIMFNKNATKLTATSIAQPAILLHSIMMLEVVKNAYKCKNVKDAGYEIALGHSLGEYTALVATEAITLSEGIQLVHKRGLAMERAMESNVDTNENQYGMYALMPTTYEHAFDLCETINGDSDSGAICNIANHNGRRQVVISGHISAIDQVIAVGKEKKLIRRATKLDVSAPFHSHYMKPAISELGEALDNIHFNDPIIPIVSNVTGETYHTSDNIKPNLLDQLYSTVQWCKNMDVCGELPNVNSFHEYGPKPILTPLLKSHFQKHEDINSFDSFCTIDDLKFIDDLNVVVDEPSRPIEKEKNLIKKYKEEDAENERLLLRSIAEQNDSDNINTSGNNYKAVFGADYDSDIDKIYRLREEKEKKQLDSVSPMGNRQIQYD
jgi:[acyl-carrier-protein] S-malonyltransferase